MTFRDKLVKLRACQESLEWVKGKTIKQAWESCENSRWMFWILTQTDLDLIDPICNIAERVLHLVPEESQLACIWAISAAKRRASKDELAAAYVATCDAASYYDVASDAASYYDVASDAGYGIVTFNYAANLAATACYDVACAAYYGTADSYDYYDAYIDAAANAAAAASAFDNTSYRKEQKKQCDIIRKYFTIDQVRKAFNKLVT